MIHNRNPRRQHGFTLIELIVVLVILGVLAALAIPTFNAIRTRGAETVALSDATSIARAATGLYALYDGEDGPIAITQDGNGDHTCTDTCDESDAVEAAAKESGFALDGSAYVKGETKITGSSSPWTVVAQEGSDNASCADITFADQAFTAKKVDCPTTP